MTWTQARAVVAVMASIPVVGLVGLAPAQAADVGSISVTTVSAPVPSDQGPPPIPEIPGVYAYTPATLTAEVGDTFTVINNTSDSRTLNVSYGGADTGSVSAGGTDCTADQATCSIPPGSTLTYTITALGTISLTAPATADLLPQVIGPILLQSPSGGGADPRDIYYPVLTLNPNGGTCTGQLRIVEIPVGGILPGVTLPTSDTCTRSDYTLSGWSFFANGSGTVLEPGITVPPGDVTLYAVWRPNGVQITYDANVGMGTQCLAGGANVTTDAGRRSTSVVKPGSNGATTAPCTPVDGRLSGWAYTGDGPAAITAGQPLPATLTTGSSVTLFAKWETAYALSPSSKSVDLRPGGSTDVTFTATVNGAPASGRVVALRTSGDSNVLSPLPDGGATTDAAGKVSVTITALSGDKSGTTTVTAAFGDKTASVDVVVGPASIEITGRRGSGWSKPDILVEGTAKGFTAGTRVVPYVRFPGGTYEPGTARPVIAADGTFEWLRKIRKKAYVYFTSEDGSVESNRIVIAAL